MRLHHSIYRLPIYHDDDHKKKYEVELLHWSSCQTCHFLYLRLSFTLFFKYIFKIKVQIGLKTNFLTFQFQVMRNFHLLMCSLALYDLVSLILDIGCFSVGKLSPHYRDNILIFAIPYLIPLTQVSIFIGSNMFLEELKQIGCREESQTKCGEQ